MTQPEPLSTWDVEHGWHAVRLFDHKVSLPEIAFSMQADQKWIARYIAHFDANPHLKSELLRRAAERWPESFEGSVIDF